MSMSLLQRSCCVGVASSDTVAGSTGMGLDGTIDGARELPLRTASPGRPSSTVGRRAARTGLLRWLFVPQTILLW